MGATQSHLQYMLGGANNRSGRLDLSADSSNWQGLKSNRGNQNSYLSAYFITCQLI